ncbi:MAG: phosphoribosylglycinamide formyltransferase [Flavipsychrobacter sp.]|nr:phosphoribosylglycinamide formyltransferase [Flavipsychrobacter sp.]
MHSLIIFASGRGSNAAAIIDHFKQNGKAAIALIVTNNPNAGVLAIAEQQHIPFLIVDKTSIKETLLIEQMADCKPSLIVLAGFMWKIPGTIVAAFRNKIVNIHPALLPAYGGKGMYGNHVHHAVLEAGEKETGITIHHVNEHYDEGDIIVQARCKVQANDTEDTLADRIHVLEHFYYPRTVEYLIG